LHTSKRGKKREARYRAGTRKEENMSVMGGADEAVRPHDERGGKAELWILAWCSIPRTLV
jgi:hypothetical protein